MFAYAIENYFGEAKSNLWPCAIFGFENQHLWQRRSTVNGKKKHIKLKPTNKDKLTITTTTTTTTAVAQYINITHTRVHLSE